MYMTFVFSKLQFGMLQDIYKWSTLLTVARECLIPLVLQCSTMHTASSCCESVLCCIETLKCVLAVTRLLIAVLSMVKQKPRNLDWKFRVVFFFSIEFFFVGISCSGLLNFDIAVSQHPKQSAKFSGQVFFITLARFFSFFFEFCAL